MRHVAFSGISAPLLVLVACSGGGAGGVGSGSGPSSSDAFATDYCDAIQPCCAQGGFRTDGVSCRALIPAVTGQTSYDAQKGGACLSEVRAAVSGAGGCASASSAPSCKTVFGTTGSRGTKAPGEACTDGSDCAANPEGEVTCTTLFASGAQESYCQLRIVGKLGDTPCVGTKSGNVTSYSTGKERVARGFVCDTATGTQCDATTKTCAAPAKIGDACTSDQGCERAARCDFTSRKCVDRIPVGGDCTGQSSGCVVDAGCDNGTKKCVARLPDGADCTTGSECATSLCVNKKCGTTGSSSFSLLCGRP